MSEAISYLWEKCRDTPLCAYNEKKDFVPSFWTPSEQEGAEFYGKITSRDAGVFLRPNSLKVLLLYQLKWQFKKKNYIGSFRTLRFFNKPLSGITRLDLIWSLQEPVVPNVICIFLSAHLFALSVFPFAFLWRLLARSCERWEGSQLPSTKRRRI